MKILDLSIKREEYDRIVSGELKSLYREVRPTTVKKFIQLDDEGYEVEDEHGNAIPVHYDALRLRVRGNKDCSTALVEVESEYSRILTQYVKWRDGEFMTFLPGEDGSAKRFMVDENDDFVVDENGEYVECPEGYDGEWLPLPLKKGEEGALIEEPIEYDYGGRHWIAEHVVFELGKVLSVLCMAGVLPVCFCSDL